MSIVEAQPNDHSRHFYQGSGSSDITADSWSAGSRAAAGTGLPAEPREDWLLVSIAFTWKLHMFDANAMLISAVRRSQTQIQGHRRWLQAFVTSSRAVELGPAQPICQHERRAPWHQSRHYAYHVPKHVRRRQRRDREAEREDGSTSTLSAQQILELELAQAVGERNITDVIRIFEELPDYRKVNMRPICRTIHDAVRKAKRAPASESRRADIDEMVDFAKRVVNRIRKGELPPDAPTHFHLLALFKDSGDLGSGSSFWQWLENQDDGHVNAAVYGIAIELLAVCGNPLSELEELYERALERFPGTFSAYHLAPNAVVSDREAPTAIPQVPMLLLQGILMARLLHGASKDAYLALDTALRLYPIQSPSRSFRFFRSFMDERPLVESFTVFAIACRAGNAPSHDFMKALLMSIRQSSDLTSPAGLFSALRQMLTLSYLYLGGGGHLTGLNEIVITLTQTLRVRGMTKLEAKGKRRVAEGVANVIRQVLVVFARAGATPGISAFNSIITNLAGFGESKQMIGVALRDAESMGLQPNDVTRRSILAAAGQLGDRELFGGSWNELVHTKAQVGERPEAADFNVLVKAARSVGAVDFAREACKGMESYMTNEQSQSIHSRLDSPDVERIVDEGTPVDVDTLLKLLDVLQADLVVFDERTKNQPGLQDFSKQTLPMGLLAPTPELRLPEEELRRLYDEMTTEQRAHQLLQPMPVTSASSDAAFSRTSISFGQLRYENWKTINNLLEWAELHDQAYEQAVDEAIAAGVAPPSRAKVFKEKFSRQIQTIGLSDSVTTTESGRDGPIDAAWVEEARSEILRLRGIQRQT
ncbi:hypothetical protein B0A50_02663 [Salinomyces thailandicus]|uniref:Pentatricopeptide repeat protein n=1 Tax=Salinomyces thailandicus TaxID=706561 RepID=A0A4U0U7N2_9PEZI|nr:hypothetical protein B0A50_02663 [Salinomyces thailandica]